MEPPRMTDAPGGAGRRQVGLRRKGVAPGPSGGVPGRCAGIKSRPARPLRQPKEEDVPSLRREGGRRDALLSSSCFLQDG